MKSSLSILIAAAVVGQFALRCCAQETGFQAPQDVTFVSQLDGSAQHYVLMVPLSFSPASRVDVMLALHGHGSDRWQFATDPRAECAAARQVAAEHGMLYVCPDYRAKTSWMSPAATADVLQILDELHSQFSVKRVLVCGGSMGGSSALALAAMHADRVHGVVSLNGTANMLQYEGFTEAITEAYGATRQAAPDIYRARSAELVPERFTFPVATTTGGLDQLVPPQSTLRLIAKLQEQRGICLSIHRPSGGHSTNMHDTRAAIEFVLRNW